MIQMWTCFQVLFRNMNNKIEVAVFILTESSAENVPCVRFRIWRHNSIFRKFWGCLQGRWGEKKGCDFNGHSYMRTKLTNWLELQYSRSMLHFTPQVIWAFLTRYFVACFPSTTEHLHFLISSFKWMIEFWRGPSRPCRGYFTDLKLCWGVFLTTSFGRSKSCSLHCLLVLTPSSTCALSLVS